MSSGHEETNPKLRIKDHPFRVDITRNQVFTVLKWTLILFNGLAILAILIGVFSHFTAFRDKTNFKLSEDVTQSSFSTDLEETRPPSSGPKYAWIMSMFAFALMLSIPCLGFIGAIKEHVCLLVLYGVIFIVNAIVMLIFRSFWFLIPTLIASAAMGLVILIRSENQAKNKQRGRMSWFLSKV